MMQVRCQRCGWVFTMSRDSIGLAVAEAGQNEHYLADCPKCRHGIKIRVDDLRRRLPADYVLPVPPPKPAPIHVKKEEVKNEEVRNGAEARSGDRDQAQARAEDTSQDEAGSNLPAERG